MNKALLLCLDVEGTLDTMTPEFIETLVAEVEKICGYDNTRIITLSQSEDGKKFEKHTDGGVIAGEEEFEHWSKPGFYIEKFLKEMCPCVFALDDNRESAYKKLRKMLGTFKATEIEYVVINYYKIDKPTPQSLAKSMAESVKLMY